MKNKRIVPILICFVALFSPTAPKLAAQSDKQDRPNASGTWKWVVSTPDGQMIQAMVALKQDGEKLTGTYNSRIGENSFGETPVHEGKISGRDISFKVIRKLNDQEFTLSYGGKIDGDRIKGSVVIGDGDQKFEWDAKREPAQLDPTGAWKWSMTRSNGEKMEATMKLKLESGKLTGSIASGDFSTEIDNGRINGDEITFQTTVDRDGQKFVAKSKGKITASKIKGTVEFETDGEKRVREWEAQKE